MFLLLDLSCCSSRALIRSHPLLHLPFRNHPLLCSTVTAADQILVLHGGRTVERGVHTELIKEDGAYCRCWEAAAQTRCKNKFRAASGVWLLKAAAQTSCKTEFKAAAVFGCAIERVAVVAVVAVASCECRCGCGGHARFGRGYAHEAAPRSWRWSKLAMCVCERTRACVPMLARGIASSAPCYSASYFPFSFSLPFSSHRHVRLDVAGAARRQQSGTSSRAVQFHPHGGQFDFVWLSARTPHVGPQYAW